MRTFNIASAIGIISLITLLSASCDTGVDKNGSDNSAKTSTSNSQMSADTNNHNGSNGTDTTGVR